MTSQSVGPTQMMSARPMATAPIVWGQATSTTSVTAPGTIASLFHVCMRTMLQGSRTDLRIHSSPARVIERRRDDTRSRHDAPAVMHGHEAVHLIAAGAEHRQ